MHDLFERIILLVFRELDCALKEIENDAAVLHILGERGDAEFVVFVEELVNSL